MTTCQDLHFFLHRYRVTFLRNTFDFIRAVFLGRSVVPAVTPRRGGFVAPQRYVDDSCRCAVDGDRVDALDVVRHVFEARLAVATSRYFSLVETLGHVALSTNFVVGVSANKQ